MDLSFLETSENNIRKKLSGNNVSVKEETSVTFVKADKIKFVNIKFSVFVRAFSLHNVPVDLHAH